MKEIDITKHYLVPKYHKLTDEEKTKILDKYNITTKQIPKISAKDPAIIKLDAKEGDLLKIERKSPTAKTEITYRAVV